MDSPLDDLPPPPAYSEQEFDQKVSRATQLSLEPGPELPALDEDGWPSYDPAAFEAVANHFAAHPLRQEEGSKRDILNRDVKALDTAVVSDPARVGRRIPSTTKPLRILKKSHRPGASSVSSIDSVTNDHSTSQEAGPSSPQLSARFPPAPSRSNTPGPWVEWASADTTTGLNEHQTPPTSPPLSPRGPHGYNHYLRPSIDSYYSSPQPVSPHSPRYSMPTQHTQPPVRLEERPMSFTPARVQTPEPWAPRVAFDPSVAYGTPTRPVINDAPVPQPTQPNPTIRYDPHSLYNSAVVPHLGASRHGPPRALTPQPPMDRPHYAPSMMHSQSSASLSKPVIIQPVRPSHTHQYGSTPINPSYGYSQTQPPYHHGGPTQ